ncbi:hypothetical protein DOD24_1614 [Staphylococcus arlettae]|nr:hypothetical protein DOD23_1124 [Staphylococcus arlettae]RBA05673.1 hypothetical protein DOD22_0052 [Staphylococcus arlettae]RBA06926.1 hypothetical protein DOD24_1614 [Staphylococcus arlettae]
MLALWYHQMAEAVPAESVHKKLPTKSVGFVDSLRDATSKRFSFLMI